MLPEGIINKRADGGAENSPMAKRKMICPFSDRLCKDCALYRGRHYYLCFCKEYRGYLSETMEATRTSTHSNQMQRPSNKFEMPYVIHTSAIDPFIIGPKDIK